MFEHDHTNRALWDAWTEAHLRSSFYDVDGFLAGDSTLASIEIDGVGDVQGRSLLHLQCHFGLDTLSWARAGARVTGLDYSGRAIGAARALAEECGLEAVFIEADVYEAAAHVPSSFDVVFTSYGALPWLRDLGEWARIAAGLLHPGGVFYMVEFHPLLDMLGDDGVHAEHPYFPSVEPVRVMETASYADGNVQTLESCTWPHPIGEVVTALCSAGLRLEHLHEHDWSPWGIRPFMREAEPGRWVADGSGQRLPLLYSVRAVKPSG